MQTFNHLFHYLFMQKFADFLGVSIDSLFNRAHPYADYIAIQRKNNPKLKFMAKKFGHVKNL